MAVEEVDNLHYVIAQVEEFLDGVGIDDCGIEHFGSNKEYKLYYEGFTSDCWNDMYKSYIDDDEYSYMEENDKNELIKLAENELLDDWLNREGENPVDYGWRGDVFYAIFYLEWVIYGSY